MAGETRIAFSDTVSGKADNGVLVVTIDNPPVNATGIDVRKGLVAAISHLEGDATLTAMMLTGAGKTFVGGADIREFGKPPIEPHLPSVYAIIEAATKPVVAAINGAALGGGLEAALACHGRIASPAASLGLPEVNLGLVPGAGGTQRLPRLVGPVEALDMISSGKPIAPKKALAIGLIDAVEDDDLVTAAVALARRLAGEPIRRTGSLGVPTFDQTAFDDAADKVMKRAKGQTAPGEAIRLVKLAANSDIEAGLAEERATFIRLRDSEESAALRHIFFAERGAGKLTGDLVDAKPLLLKVVGVVGTGLMGCGIVVASLAAGYRVAALDQTEEAAEKGRERIAGMIDQSVKAGRMTAEAATAQLGRLTTGADFALLSDADLVIEAVFDDLQVKTDLLKRLDGIVRDDAILATNTSYLNPDEIAAATARPERVLGLHFFSPANIMRLLEVVRCEKTAPAVLASGIAFGKSLKKIPVISGVCEGFIGNSIFSAYRTEAEWLLQEGALPQDIDRAMENFGFPMGPFTVFDMAGLEIAWARRKRQAATRDPEAPYFAIPDRLCEAGRFGRKSGKGWYLYPEGRKAVDPEIDAMIAAYRVEKGVAARVIGDDEIVARLLSAMTRQGRALLDTGIAQSTADIDVVLVHGYGFPARCGGPMFIAEQATKKA